MDLARRPRPILWWKAHSNTALILRKMKYFKVQNRFKSYNRWRQKPEFLWELKARQEEQTEREGKGERSLRWRKRWATGAVASPAAVGRWAIKPRLVWRQLDRAGRRHHIGARLQTDAELPLQVYLYIRSWPGPWLGRSVGTIQSWLQLGSFVVIRIWVIWFPARDGKSTKSNQQQRQIRYWRGKMWFGNKKLLDGLI